MPNTLAPLNGSYASSRRRALRITLAALVLACACGLPTTLTAQGFGDFKEYVRLMRINAAEHFEFCYPAATPASEPYVIGVMRDSLGRPTVISRFRFGNPDTKSDWATMRISYRRYDSLDIILERRTWYNAGNAPIPMWRAMAEEVYYRRNGTLVQRKIVDAAGKPVDDSADVSRAMFRLDGPGVYNEDWYISTGKTHFGTGSDAAIRPFAAMPPGVYLRRFSIDEHGSLLREQLLDFRRTPLAFPGGEMVRVYELDDCRQPVRISFRTLDDTPMTDARGVATVTRAYDDSGRLIDERTLDNKGRLKGVEPDGVAITHYNYRAFDGFLLGVDRFDEDEKPVKP